MPDPDPQVVLDTFEQVPVILGGLTGPEHRFDAANAAYRGLMGGRDVMGVPAAQMFPELLSQQILGLCDEVYATGRPASIREWRFQFGVGDSGELQEFFMDVTFAPRRDAGGVTTGLTVWALDATERVQQRQAAERETAAVRERYAAARDVIGELQEALLPADLPLLPGVDLAARYLVAAHDQAAGGDWFDAVPLPDGTVALIVGDVVGHGVAASAAMGQLRAVLATVLLQTGDVRQALQWVDDMASAAPRQEFATVTALHEPAPTSPQRRARVAAMRAATLLLAVLDPRSGRLRYASCGHPPALVASLDGTTRFLPATDGGPLGTGGELDIREERLQPGDTLLLYSDGLVERPGRRLHDGLDRLARAAADAVANRVMPVGAATSVPERVCQQVVELLTRAGHDDDVTALAAQIRTRPSEPLHVELPADPGAVPVVRERLVAWLTALDVTPHDLDSIDFAVEELTANVVEHAYPDGSRGAVRLDAELLPDGQVRVRVADDGTWREPTHPPSATHGRGLWLVGETVDAVHLDVGSAGGRGRLPDPALTGTTVTVSHAVRRAAVLAKQPAGVQRRDPSTPFGVDVTEADDGAVIAVRGAVDITTAAELADRIATSSRGGVNPVTVDLRDVDLLSSAGVRVLFTARDDHARHGNTLRLTTTPGSLTEQVLTLVGLAHDLV